MLNSYLKNLECVNLFLIHSQICWCACSMICLHMLSPTSACNMAINTDSLSLAKCFAICVLLWGALCACCCDHLVFMAWLYITSIFLLWEKFSYGNGIPRIKHSKNQFVLHRLLCLCPKRIWHSVLPGYLLNELVRRWITSGRCTVVQLACWNCCGFHDWCWSGFGQPCQIRLPQCCHHWKVISSS